MQHRSQPPGLFLPCNGHCNNTGEGGSRFWERDLHQLSCWQLYLRACGLALAACNEIEIETLSKADQVIHTFFTCEAESITTIEDVSIQIQDLVAARHGGAVRRQDIALFVDVVHPSKCLDHLPGSCTLHEAGLPGSACDGTGKFPASRLMFTISDSYGRNPLLSMSTAAPSAFGIPLKLARQFAHR